MSYDSHSKHVILIAIVHILGYVFYVLAPATTGIIMFASSGDPASDTNSITAFNLISVSFYMLMTVFAALMIRGVVKQSHTLIAPWLIMSTLSLLSMFTIFLMNFLVESDIFINLAYYLETLGMQILVIYPTYTLYMKLRPKSLKQDSNSYNEAVEKKIKVTDQVLV